MLDLDTFDTLTFDCYGTLIDWERGILEALGRVYDAHGVPVDADPLLEAFARHEAEIESGTYVRYAQVLAQVLRLLGREHGFSPSEEEVAAFACSVRDWPAFPDSSPALRRLASRYEIVVITNCDDDLFDASAQRLEFDFDRVVTAEQVSSYKPSEHNFEVALEAIGRPRERVLHVAQSLFHDHVPAKRLGLSTVWVNRRGDRDGPGATPPAAAEPDLVVPDLATLAELAFS
jgi:2-haloacid dehalogenase